MGVMLDTIGQVIAGYLQKEVPGYEPFTPSDPERLHGVIEPGDVLLVEGNNRISGIIKYLTQSTWSHGALYVGPVDGAFEPDGEPHVLIEANIGEGVTSAPPVEILSLSHPPLPPDRPVLRGPHHGVPLRHQPDRLRLRHREHRRPDALPDPAAGAAALAARMIAFGSGDPTKFICSALIAQAFDAVRFPILPKITRAASRRAGREILRIRNSSLYMPRDSTSRPISKSSNPPSCTASTTRPCTGPTSRSRSRR